MKVTVRHPGVLFVLWFFIGALAYEYGLETVANWTMFCFGVTGAYILISKHL